MQLKQPAKTDYVYTNLDELLVAAYNCLSVGRAHLFMNLDTSDPLDEERWLWLFEMDICLESLKAEINKRIGGIDVRDSK